MKITVQRDYKPEIYEVTFDFTMIETEADSFNKSKREYNWTVYEVSAGQACGSGTTLDLALQNAAVTLSERAWMERWRAEEKLKEEIRNKRKKQNAKI